MKTDAIRNCIEMCEVNGLSAGRGAEAELTALEAENAELKRPIDQRIHDLDARLGMLNEEACAVARHATKLEVQIVAKDARIAKLENALAYFVSYHNDGVGQLTHVLARAEGILSSEPSGKLEDLLQLTKETQQFLTTLNLVAVNREKLREIEFIKVGNISLCPVCSQGPYGQGHADGCWLAAFLKEDRCLK